MPRTRLAARQVPAAPHSINGFRLTADLDGLPVPAGDVVGATVLRCAAYSGGQIGLLDTAGIGSLYTHPTASFESPRLSGTAGAIYDSFAYLLPGTPTVVGTGTFGGTSTPFASATCTLPANANGDLLVLAVQLDNGTATPVTPPAGWTQLKATGNTGTAQSLLCTKTSAGSEGSVSVNFSSAAGTTAVKYVAYAVRNVVVASSAGANGTGSPFTAASLTAPAGSLLLTVAFVGASQVITGPAPQTKVTGQGCYGGYESVTATGATGSRLGSTSPSTAYAAYSLCLRGGLALERSSLWAGSARSDALALVNGIRVKASDITRRWVGTYRMLTGDVTEDSQYRPWVFSADNRVHRTALASGPAGTVSTSGAAYSAIDGSFLCPVLLGEPTAMRATLTTILTNPSATLATADAYLGLLIGSTDYDLGSSPCDTLGTGAGTQQLYSHRQCSRDVPGPLGLSNCTPRWRFGGGGSVQIAAGSRGAIATGCNLQLTYPR